VRIFVTFEEFAAARVPVLIRTAVALSGDLGLAEDLVQEVLIRIHQRWDQIGDLSARDSYVRRMLVNEFLSWRRKWARIVPLGEIASTGAHPDHTTAHADRDLLRQEIRKLSRRRQAVLALRYYSGLTDAEIADAMGCRVSTVRSLASRALADLRIAPTLRSEFTVDFVSIEQGRAQ
jgi:RNA polymerase sigma-70 factor (sigma-E family)